MVRDNGQRKILYDMDTAIQSLSAKMPDDPSLIKLAGVYHNLLRYWLKSREASRDCHNETGSVRRKRLPFPTILEATMCP